MKVAAPTCEVPGCRHDVWSRNYCALHFAEHFPDIEGRVTPQKKELVRMSLTQNLRKVYATKKTHFGFGRKFISSEAQLVIAMLKDVTTVHKGKEVAKVYSEIIIKTFAKAKNLHEQGMLVGQDEKARHEFEFIRTSMCELVLRLLHILKGSVSLMMRRVAEEEYETTLGELFSLPELEDHFKKVALMLLPALNSKLRQKNVYGIREILNYYGSAEFWLFFMGRRDWEDRRTILINLLYELLEPLIAYKCLDERCLKASLPPLLPFRGSPFCAAHHLDLIGSALKWYQMPGPERVDRARDCTIPPPTDGPPPLISFKKYVQTECPNRELYFTMHRILTDYKDCKDPKMRLAKAVRIIKTHLQHEALEPLLFPNNTIRDEILTTLFETCKAQQFTNETFFPLWIMIVHEINLVFQQFLHSKLIKESIHGGLLIPALILSRYGPKPEDGHCFKKLAFSDQPPLERPPLVFDGEEPEEEEEQSKPEEDPDELYEDLDAERYDYDFIPPRRRSRSMLRGSRKQEDELPSRESVSAAIREISQQQQLQQQQHFSCSSSSSSSSSSSASIVSHASLPSYIYRLTLEGTFTWSTEEVYDSTPVSSRPPRDADSPPIAQMLGEIARSLIPPNPRAAPKEKKQENKEDTTTIKISSDSTTTTTSTTSDSTISTTTTTTNANNSPDTKPLPSPSTGSTSPLLTSTTAPPHLEKMGSGPNATSKMYKIFGWTNQIRRGSGGHTLNGSPPTSGSKGSKKPVQNATLPKNMKLDPVPITLDKPPSPKTSASFPPSQNPTPLSLSTSSPKLSSSFPTASSTTSTVMTSSSSSQETILSTASLLSESKGVNAESNGMDATPSSIGHDGSGGSCSSDGGSSGNNGTEKRFTFSGGVRDSVRGHSGDEEKIALGERRRINSWDVSDRRFPKESHGMGTRSESAPILAIELEKRGEAHALWRATSNDAFDNRDRAQSIMNEDMFLSKLAEDIFRVVPTGDDSDDENAVLG